MLVPGKTLPGVYGAASPKENAADLRTKGYELTLSWNDKFNLAGKPFTYGVSFALGDNISKITKYDNPTKDFNVSQYYEGMTIGEIWGYKIDGLFKTDEEAAAYQAEIDHSLIAKNILQTATGKYKGLKAGDPKFVDLDGNGRIDDGEKRQTIVVTCVSSATPAPVTITAEASTSAGTGSIFRPSFKV